MTQAAGSGSAYGYGVVLQPDGKIVVGGYDSNTRAGTDMIAARFNTNGSLDDGGGSDSTPGDIFGTAGIATAGLYAGADDHATSIALSPSGDIILAGDTTSGGTVLMAVAEFTTSGTLDTNFSSDGLLALAAGNANAVAVDGIGRITVAGSALRSGHSDTDFALARINADGSYDTGFGATGTLSTDFNSGYYDSAYALALTGTSVIAVGGTGSASATGDFAIAMYTPGGTAVQRVYAEHDANHNVTSLLNTAGTVVQRFTYLPYGQSQVLTSGWTSTSDAYDWAYRFQGGRLETGTGKVYFRNRDYDVTTGTWEEEDPMGAAGSSSNLYEAAASSPATYVDPSGTLVIFVHGIGETQHKDKMPEVYNGMGAAWDADKMPHQAGVLFLYGPAQAPDPVSPATKPNGEAASGQVVQAAKELAIFVKQLRDYEKAHGNCPEPIYLYGYSLGAAVIKSALEDGMDVDGVVIAGGAGVSADQSWQNAMKHISKDGKLNNYYSNADDTNGIIAQAGTKITSGTAQAFIGHTGLSEADKKSGEGRIRDTAVPNVDHYSNDPAVAKDTNHDPKKKTEWDSYFLGQLYYGKDLQYNGAMCLSANLANDILNVNPSKSGFYVRPPR